MGNVAALKDAKGDEGEEQGEGKEKKDWIRVTRNRAMYVQILVGCQDKGLRGKGREEDMRGGKCAPGLWLFKGNV